MEKNGEGKKREQKTDGVKARQIAPLHETVMGDDYKANDKTKDRHPTPTS